MRRIYDTIKTFIGNVLFWFYILVLAIFGFVFLSGSVFGAFMGAFSAPWWVLIGGSLMYLIGTWWEGQDTLFGKMRNYAFIFFCTAILGGYIWLMGTGGDASQGSYLRLTSLRNIWLGMLGQPLAFVTFPLMVWGSIETLIRLWQYLVQHFATSNVRGLAAKLLRND